VPDDAALLALVLAAEIADRDRDERIDAGGQVQALAPRKTKDEDKEEALAFERDGRPGRFRPGLGGSAGLRLFARTGRNGGIGSHRVNLSAVAGGGICLTADGETTGPAAAWGASAPGCVGTSR